MDLEKYQNEFNQRLEHITYLRDVEISDVLNNNYGGLHHIMERENVSFENYSVSYAEQIDMFENDFLNYEKELTIGKRGAD